MSGEDVSETPPERDLPEPVRDWLAGIAAERGVTEVELLGRLVDSGDDESRRVDAHTERLDAIDDDLDGTEERVEELSASMNETRADVADKINDVRERVVQVKREADSKAPADHDHPAIDEELEGLLAEFDALQADVADLRSDLDELDAHVTTGFENFESVLEYLTDATDDLDRKLDRLVGAMIDLRGRLRSLSSLEAERTAVADLAADANRHGTRTAACGSCEESVDLGLLHAPRCPHCDAGFESFEPKEWFFGSHTLRTGDVPALEGEVVAPDAEDLSSVVEEEKPTEVRDVGDHSLTDEIRESSGPSDGPVVDDTGNEEAGETLSAEADSTRSEAGDADAGEASPSGSRADEAGEERPGDDAEAENGEGADAKAENGDGDDADAATGGRPLQAIDGVGPAYADRLRDAGVASVEQLIDADADDLSAEIDVSAARIERWIERAAAITNED